LIRKEQFNAKKGAAGAARRNVSSAGKRGNEKEEEKKKGKIPAKKESTQPIRNAKTPDDLKLKKLLSNPSLDDKKGNSKKPSLLAKGKKGKFQDDVKDEPEEVGYVNLGSGNSDGSNF
jgi:hypothetical protein